MGINVKIVNALENFAVAGPLLLANWQENHMPVDFKLEDVRRFYEHLDKMGALFAVGAYDDADGTLVGYCIITIAPYPFNHAVKVCNADGVYMVQDCRGGRGCAMLMQAVQDFARVEGVQAIQWHAPADSEFSRVLAKRFKPLSNYFVEELKHG